MCVAPGKIASCDFGRAWNMLSVCSSRITSKPDEDAAVIAYLLSYNCVQAAGDGKQELPVGDVPDLQKVELGSASCPPK